MEYILTTRCFPTFWRDKHVARYQRAHFTRGQQWPCNRHGTQVYPAFQNPQIRVINYGTPTYGVLPWIGVAEWVIWNDNLTVTYEISSVIIVKSFITLHGCQYLQIPGNLIKSQNLFLLEDLWITKKIVWLFMGFFMISYITISNTCTKS